METIDNSAFRKCTGLTDVEFGSVETIGAYAFRDCTGLTNLVFANVKTIGNYAFYGCTGVTEIELNAVEAFYGVSFRDCSALKKVTLPSTLTRLASDALNDCDALAVVFYRGTAEQWNSIPGAHYWNDRCRIVCLGMPGDGTAGNPAEAYCGEYVNCAFVAE